MSTATQPLAIPRNGVLTLAQDYMELIKLRVTTLIIMTAWCGYYFGAAKSGVTQLLKDDFGWTNILDLGDITGARGMEMILPIWLRLMTVLKTPMFNFHIAQ